MRVQAMEYAAPILTSPTSSAVRAEAGEGVLDVVDGEHDAVQTQRVYVAASDTRHHGRGTCMPCGRWPCRWPPWLP